MIIHSSIISNAMRDVFVPLIYFSMFQQSKGVIPANLTSSRRHPNVIAIENTVGFWRINLTPLESNLLSC